MSDEHDPNKMLCYCLGVRYGKVTETIREHGCRKVDQVTRLCKAGGGCKSCHPEILELIESVRKDPDREPSVKRFWNRIFSPRETR